MRFILHAHTHAKNHYHRHYVSRFQQRAHLVLIFDAALVAAVLLLLGGLVYLRYGYTPLRDDLRVSVFAENLRAGERAEVRVQVENAGKRPLGRVETRVFLPKEFRTDALDAPAGLHGLEGDFGALARAQSAERAFGGVLLAPPGEATVYVRTSAADADGRTDEKLTVQRIRWNESLITAELRLPASAVAGQRTTSTLTVRNGSEFSFDDAAVAFKWPEGFRVLASTPPLFRGAARLGTLAAGEEVRIEIDGVYDGRASGVFAEAKVQARAGDETLTIAAARAEMKTVASDLVLETSLLYDRSGRPFEAGEFVNVSVRYRNDGAYTLRNVLLSLPLDERIVAENRGASEFIGTIAPGETGVFETSFTVRDSFSRFLTNPLLSLVPQATFSIPEADVTEAAIRGTGPSVKVAGQAVPRVIARYFTTEGDQIGRGPLPPRVGQATRYWIFLSVENGTSDLRDVMVMANLSEATWTGRAAVTQGDQPALATAGGVLVWQAGDIAAHAGADTGTPPTLSFEVSLEPQAEDAGTVPVLLYRAGIGATDGWTGEEVAFGLDAPTTTALPQDAFVRGRTTVRP